MDLFCQKCNFRLNLAEQVLYRHCSKDNNVDNCSVMNLWPFTAPQMQPRPTSCSFPMLLAQVELETFSPLYWGGKKEGKWTWLKPIDCAMSSRGIEERTECWLMPHLKWKGGDNGFHLAVLAFFMVRDRVGMSSVWWHRRRSLVSPLSWRPLLWLWERFVGCTFAESTAGG